ncbi:hypothetical protein [uncultured Clostridium sp.]|uniref:hypothetical protein n=1 Tax=uncultured Clostridium sp. TaxID=59620 RepID=UPI002639807D|nr:hypothetical protein [uncultured Clostridium sp.]
MSNNLLYDTATHEYLGNYLRMLRDFDNIDLMPFYNCINGIVSNNIRIETTVSNETDSNGNNIIKLMPNIITNNTTEDNYKVLMASIRFNQDYTIYINSMLPCKITAICYDGVSQVSNYISETGTGVEVLSTSSFSKPFVYRVNQKADYGFSSMYYRNYLTLLLQVPKNCNNVVVLEGNYKDNKLVTNSRHNEIIQPTYSFVNKENERITFNNFNKKEMNNYCKIIPSLIYSTENKLHAFDLKLIEYLLKNVISNHDDISKNIERIQTYISSYEHQKFNGTRFEKSYIKGT